MSASPGPAIGVPDAASAKKQSSTVRHDREERIEDAVERKVAAAMRHLGCELTAVEERTAKLLKSEREDRQSAIMGVEQIIQNAVTELREAASPNGEFRAVMESGPLQAESAQRRACAELQNLKEAMKDERQIRTQAVEELRADFEKRVSSSCTEVQSHISAAGIPNLVQSIKEINSKSPEQIATVELTSKLAEDLACLQITLQTIQTQMDHSVAGLPEMVRAEVLRQARHAACGIDSGGGCARPAPAPSETALDQVPRRLSEGVPAGADGALQHGMLPVIETVCAEAENDSASKYLIRNVDEEALPRCAQSLDQGEPAPAEGLRDGSLHHVDGVYEMRASNSEQCASVQHQDVSWCNPALEQGRPRDTAIVRAGGDTPCRGSTPRFSNEARAVEVAARSEHAQEDALSAVETMHARILHLTEDLAAERASRREEISRIRVVLELVRNAVCRLQEDRYGAPEHRLGERCSAAPRRDKATNSTPNLAT